MRELTVDRCRACEPIVNLVDALLGLGYSVESQELRDYHFNELRFILSKSGSHAIPTLKIDGIKRVRDTFICDCHWSIVEIQMVVFDNYGVRIVVCGDKKYVRYDEGQVVVRPAEYEVSDHLIDRLMQNEDEAYKVLIELQTLKRFL